MLMMNPRIFSMTSPPIIDSINFECWSDVSGKKTHIIMISLFTQIYVYGFGYVLRRMMKEMMMTMAITMRSSLSLTSSSSSA